MSATKNTRKSKLGGRRSYISRQDESQVSREQAETFTSKKAYFATVSERAHTEHMVHVSFKKPFKT